MCVNVRNSSSPKHQAYYSSSYKPNINDLRQLFDDTKRMNDRGIFPSKSQLMEAKGQLTPQSLCYDAKGTLGECEGMSEGRQKFDFERAKQKFDKNGKVTGGKGGSSGGSRSSSVSGKKLTESYNMELGISKQNFNETVQFFDENMRKKDGYMKTSLNLDGLKISDDEVSKGDL